MADGNTADFDIAGRCSSPAPPGASEPTVLSRSPTPVLENQQSRRDGTALPLTPPSTPDRPRAANGRFRPCKTKRATSPDPPSPSKRNRSLQKPRSSQPDHTDAFPLSPKPVLCHATPWTAGKGGCGTLQVLPTELRQKIYAFAFDIDNPVIMKECCGATSTARERSACQKHGDRAAAQAGRFNILHVSKSIREEARWIVLTQGSLLLKLERPLENYLGFYRWNSTRPSGINSADTERKSRMWAAAGQYRHVELQMSMKALYGGDPGLYINSFAGVASSICQSWNAGSPEMDLLRAVKVDLGNLFQHAIPFNALEQDDSFELFIQISRLPFLSQDAPDLVKAVAACGRNLLRLVAVAAKYRDKTEWSFTTNTEFEEERQECGGLRWLETFRAECATYGMVLEHESQ